MNPRVVRTAFQQSYQCPSCIARQTRPFSCSPVSSIIGPESPRYIKVPEPPQQTSPQRQRIRGVLPVPRDIFTGITPGRGTDKADPEYLDLATKEPKQRRAKPVQDERLAWKARMADTRRRNLREGISALRDRKVKQQNFLAARSKQRQDDRNARLTRPISEDDRLTAPSVDPELLKLLESTSFDDQDHTARLAEMRERVAQHEAARKEDRASALHDLYLNARDFIVTEAQLNTAIDREFGTDEAPRVFAYHSDGPKSIWNAGAPSSIEDMLARAQGKGGMGAVKSASRNIANVITQDRITRMAEELTGGKSAPKPTKV